MPGLFTKRSSRATATIAAVILAFSASSAIAVACETGTFGWPSFPTWISTVWHVFCPPSHSQPPPVQVYCPPSGVHYSGYNQVSYNGMHQCCPQGTSPFPITYQGHQTPNTVCCPTGSSPTGSDNVCCPSGQTGYMWSDNKSDSCCPNGTSPTGADHVCCPTGQMGYLSSDHTNSGCCPNGMSPTGTNNVCCPSGQSGYMTSDHKTTGCCPNGTSPSGTNNVCCPSGQTGYMFSDNKTTGCCPSGTSPTGSKNVCCPSGQTGYLQSDNKTPGCCPNGSSPTGSNNTCCPDKGSSYGYPSSNYQSQPKGCCPANTKISFRWHYSGNSGGSSWSSGSWSSTYSNYWGKSWSSSQQAMEGSLKVNPGSSLKVGYDLTVPGNNSKIAFTVNSPSIVFSVRCVYGSPTSGSFTATLPSQTYTFSDSGWYPSGSQSGSENYQGSVTVPNLCHGGQLLLSAGGTYSTSTS